MALFEKQSKIRDLINSRVEEEKIFSELGFSNRPTLIGKIVEPKSQSKTKSHKEEAEAPAPAFSRTPTMISRLMNKR